ncbi:hypothetical protein [Flavobacterium sp.]|uniref:hypothetical protein n=1 Tax=Flavobacterium sp. TaxID=239 RepID=UPI0039E38511
MISIYQKNITEELCREYCEGFIDDRGNKVSGMLEWIKNRIEKNLETEFDDKRNTKYIKEISAFKNLLTDNKIQEILTGKPDELLELWNKEFLKFKDSKIISRKIVDKKVTYPRVNLISLIFNYTSFRKINDKKKFGGFLLAKRLGVECCPYCNRNYTTTHATYRDKKVFPEYDHFYHKSSYPLFAVSFYNLIPCCNVCNTHFKGSKDAIIENLFHPYTELQPNSFNFKFIPDNVESLYGAKDNFNLDFKISDPVNKTNLENSLAFFGIKDIYELCHSDLIKEIVNKKLAYSQKYLEMIKNTYGISFEESYRILFEVYYEDDKLHVRPFSKLKKDIFDDKDIS